MFSNQGLWTVLGAVVVGLAGLVILRTLRSRRAQLEKLSAMLGLTLQPDESEVQASGLLDGWLFKNTRSRCQNILGGAVRGTRALVFDYAMHDGHRWQLPDPVVFFRPQEPLPRFDLRPRASSKDPSGLPFETHPRFNEIYALSGSDEKPLRRLFRSDVLDFFERSENQNWAVVSTGEWLATAFWPLGERSRVLAPKEVLGFFEDAKEVLFQLTGVPAQRASR